MDEYSKISNHGSKAQCINLDVSKDSSAVYLAFSQDLWSKKGVANNIAQRDKFMSKFDILEFIDGSKKHSTQQHILPSDTPEQWIEEYKVDKNGHKQQFGWSGYATDNLTAMSNLKTLAAKYDEEKNPNYQCLWCSMTT